MRWAANIIKVSLLLLKVPFYGDKFKEISQYTKYKFKQSNDLIESES